MYEEWLHTSAFSIITLILRRRDHEPSPEVAVSSSSSGPDFQARGKFFATRSTTLMQWSTSLPTSYPPNEFAGPEEERKGPTEHRRLYLGRTVSLSFPLPPLIAIRR